MSPGAANSSQDETDDSTTVDPSSGIRDQDTSETEPPPEEEYSEGPWELDATADRRHPVAKLVLTIDNSESMQDERDLLIAGLRKLKPKLIGNNIKLILLSTGKFYKPSRKYFNYLADGQKKEVTVGEKGLTYHQLDTAIPDPKRRDHIFTIEKGMSSRAVSREVEDLIQALVDMPPDEARETGLGAMYWSLVPHAAGNLLEGGDRVAFLVFSDEDDSTGARELESRRETEFEEKVSYRFVVGGVRVHAPMMEETGDTGALVRNDSFQKAIHCSSDKISLEDCLIDKAQRSCNRTIYDYFVAHVARDGLHPIPSSTESFDGCRMQRAEPLIARGFSNGFSNPEIDYCNDSFTIGDNSYSSLTDYVQRVFKYYLMDGTCESHRGSSLIRDKIKITHAFSSVEPVDPNIGHSPVSVFVTSADELLGKGAYGFAAFIRDRTEDQKSDDCPSLSSSHAEYGPTYRMIAEAIGAKARVKSLCENEYGSTIGEIVDFLTVDVKPFYKVNFDPAKGRVGLVKIKRAGKEIEAEIGRDVRVESNRLIFADGFLQEGDKIYVELKK